MAYPLDAGTTYTKTISSINTLNDPTHSTEHNNAGTELEALKKRANGYYYVGAYKTASNTYGEALISAVSAANTAGKGMVVLAPGQTHTVSQTIPIKSNVGIIGHGFGDIIKLANNTNLTVIQNDSAAGGNENIYLYNFAVDGNRLNQTSETINIEFRNCNRVTIDNVFSYSAGADGMGFWYTSDYVKITNCYAYNNGTNGFFFEGPDAANKSHQGTYMNLHSWQNGQSAGGGDGIRLIHIYSFELIGFYTQSNGRNGIAMDSCSNCVLQGIISENNTQGGIAISNSYEIQLDSVQTNTNGVGYSNIILNSVTRSQINNFVSNYAQGGHGIYMYGTSYDNLIANGICYDNEYYGMYMTNTDDSKINNVIFENNAQYGFRMNNCDNNTVMACTAKNNSTGATGANDGFRYDGTSTHNTFIGCHSYDNNVTPKQRWGITYGDTADYNIISNCHVYDNATGQISSNTNDTTGNNITT